MGISPVAGGRRRRLRPYLAVAAAVVLGAGAAAGATAASASTAAAKVSFAGYHVPAKVSASLYHNKTATPIKHVVVIFDENESFDHYFGTYPYAANTDGTTFTAKTGTPTVNGLYSKITKKSGPIGPLLTDNPNEYNPQRLTHSEALTSDQNHSYTPEQQAEDNGKMDMFVQKTESSTPTNGCGVEYCPPGIVMDYYDGNTVTALWNYAQYYSMSDNNWDTSFGPSTPGAVNVTSGNTSGAEALNPAWDTTGAGTPTTSSSIIDTSAKSGLGTLYGDEDPYYDDCSDTNHTTDGALAALTGENIGDLLNAKNVSWGWFEGGFTPTGTSDAPGTTQALPVCGSAHTNIGGRHDSDQRLRAAPRAVPVLRVDREPGPPAAELAGPDRLHRPGQPPVRHLGLHRRPQRHRRSQAAGRELPQAPGLRGRPPRLLRPPRRADLPGQHHQLDREVQVLAVDRDRHHLRRLGRLVRPPGAGHHRRVQRRDQHQDDHLRARTTPRCAPRSR